MADVAPDGNFDIKHLTHDLLNGDVRERYIAALNLEQTSSKDALPALIAALKDEHWYIRNSAAKALGNLRDRRAVRPLINSLGDDNPGVRKNAAAALAQIGDKRAVPALIGTLDDTRHYVRYEAIMALGQIGGVEAVRALTNACDNPTDLQVALKALQTMNTPEAALALQQKQAQYSQPR